MSKNGQKMGVGGGGSKIDPPDPKKCIFLYNARYKYPLYSQFRTWGVGGGEKWALWSPIFAFLQGVPPRHNLFWCWYVGWA